MADERKEDAHAEGSEAPLDPSRRKVLGVLAAAGGCAIAAGAGAPAMALVLAPAGAAGASGGGRWVRTVQKSSLKEGEAQRVAIVSERRDAWSVERDVVLGSVWLVLRGDALQAFSAVCPHLGCSVNAHKSGFACPCHTSAFDADGKRTAGPSPRDLDALSTRVDGEGYVEVDFKKFRIGVPERVAT
jgi:menaquinol-cytochrome c reductase iron-sulfur subunit